MKNSHYKKKQFVKGKGAAKVCFLIILTTIFIISLEMSGCMATPETSGPTSSATTVTTTAASGTATTVATTAASSTATSAQTTGTTQHVFSLAELSQYDGKNGQPAYVAVDGVVYDVTNVKGWNSGTHQGYAAGQDLTKDIAKAPHGTDILKGVPIVGILQG